MDRAMTNAKNRFLPILSSSLFRILFAEGSAAAILIAPGIHADFMPRSCLPSASNITYKRGRAYYPSINPLDIILGAI